MAFLFRKRGLDNLVTCIVDRDGETWSVSWAAGGRTPADFAAPSLSAAVERASSEVAGIYDGHPEQASAELQFAIYPWQGGAGKVILDISRDGGGLSARDIQGTGVTFHSESIDAVVTDAGRYLADTNEAMIRWILPISRLTRG